MRETDRDKWVIATDASNVFHGAFAPIAGGKVKTAQPYFVKGDTEDEVVAKCFENPQRNEHGEYDFSQLTPKAAADIIAGTE